jgi:Aminopeptidase N
VWLHEGFGMYTEVLYVEDRLGYPMSVHYLLEKRKGIANRRAIVGPRDEYYWGFEDSYNKGAWILHTLRNVLDDDEMFFGILYGFQQEFASQIVCTEDLVEYINSVSGQDFNAFFNQYIFDRRPPVLEFNITDNKLFYRYNGIVDGFTMPINVLVNKEEIRLQPTTSTQELNIPDYATVQIMDWEYLILKKENNMLKIN